MYYQSVNGKQVNQISLNDRGLAYGDGIFTTAKVSNGCIELLDKHIERLIRGCKLLKITGVDFVALETELIDVCKSYDLAVLKVVITSGEGGRGYSRLGVNGPNVIIKLSEFPHKYLQWQKEGITLSDSSIKLGINPIFLGLKHLNRLEQVLLREELDNTHTDDLLVFNIFDHVIETTCANVFWFKNNELFTPKIEDSGISGIIRAEIIRKYPNIKIVEAKREDINNADSIFITNSIMDIIPVINYEGRELNINQVHQFVEHIESLD